MNEGKYIFSQVADYIPRYQFNLFVKKYKGNYRAHELSCYNQFLHLLFGQLTNCTSLRDICLCLKAHESSLYQLGFRNTVDSSSLSRANERRDYRIYEELGYYLIDTVRPLYKDVHVSNVTVDNTLFALDSTTISVSIKLATWALGKYNRGDVKMHTLLDLKGSIPTQIFITDGRCHDSNILDRLQMYPNAIYTADKAYFDLKALFDINLAGAYFIVRPRGNMKYSVIEVLKDGEPSNICGDFLISLSGYKSKTLYPSELRLVRAKEPATGEIIDFISNNMDISASDVANIYRHRWDIEVFFKWIKQNIVIKTLWGYSVNAVKTHLWVAICAYLILARIKADHKSEYSITEVATLISVSALERISLRELLTMPQEKLHKSNQSQEIKERQLKLF